MENLINQQRRARFSESGYGDLSSIGDGNMPQEGRKGKTWFQVQFSGQSSLDQEPINSEYAAAVAASAFSIHSAEEQKRKKIRDEFEASRDKIKTMTIDVKSSGGGVTRRSSNKEAEASTSKVPESRLAQQARTTSRVATGNGHPNQMQSRANVWERAQMDKIRKRYEKMKSNIVEWEKEKKMKAKVSMEKKKSAIEERKAMNNLHYQSKVARIEGIAKGARFQADEKRKSEEAQVKKAKAKMIRSGKGGTFNYCFCF